MFIAVERYLSNISGRAGTLLVLDDLQWVGGDALDLLAHLIHSTRIRRLRILGAFRSTEALAGLPFSSFITDLARMDLVGQFELGPLEPDNALALASSVLSTDEGVLTARAVERAGGVPLYLVNYARLVQTLGDGLAHDESSARMAIEEDKREQANTLLRSSPQQTEELSWNVKQSIRERVAALPISAQELLGVAAVIGQRASAALLAAGADQSEAEAITSLEIACQAGLLVEDDERGRPERYHFAHDVIRDVVEADLSVGRQALLHRRVAVALELRLQRGGTAGQASHVNDRMLAQIAFHYAQADMPEQEARYLRLAGDHARRVYAHQEAAQHYQELIACLDRLEQRREAAQARKDLAVELAHIGHFREAMAPLEQAEEICRELGDAETLAQVAMISGQLHAALGTSEEGLAHIFPLVVAYSKEVAANPDRESLTSTTVAAQLQGALSSLSFMAGRYQDALQAAERAVELAQATGDARLLARQRLNLGVALFTVGRLVEATRELEDALGNAEDASDDLDTLAEALRMAIWVYQTRGLFAESQAAQAHGLDVAQRLGDVVGLGHILFLDALLAFYTGEWKRARVIAESSLAVFDKLELTYISAYPPLGLGWLSIIEGNQDAGERYLAEAEAIAKQSGSAQVLRFVTSLWAECELLAGQAQAANERLAPWFAGEPMQERTRLELNVLRAWAAVELDTADAAALVADTVRSARASDMRLILSDALRVQALWALHQRRWREAETALDEAIGLSRDLPYPYAEAKALYVSGQMWMARGEPERARARYAEALAICQQLGERLYGEAIAKALAAKDDIQHRNHYPTDLSDAEWALVERLVPAPKTGGRPISWSRREVLNGICYAVFMKVSWRDLPHDLPPWHTVYDYYRQWRKDGTWETLYLLLDSRLRPRVERG